MEETFRLLVVTIVTIDAPPPLGKDIQQVSLVDANLAHNLLTGHAVTGVMHMFNQTLGDFYTHKQATVETSTYGSEFVAGGGKVLFTSTLRS